MTNGIVTQPITPATRDLRLSQIAHFVGVLLAEAQELQSGGTLADPKHTGEVMVRLMAPGVTDAAAEAATKFAQQVANSVAESVAGQWSTHSHGSLIRSCLAEMAQAVCQSAEIIPIVYMRALNNPHLYCRCGAELDTTLRQERGRCDGCWTTESALNTGDDQ
jgi:hypothetical protein